MRKDTDEKRAAYSDTMEIMLVAATALSVVPLLLSLLMPDWYLGDQQNAVEEADFSARRSRSTSLARPRPSDDEGNGQGSV